MGEWREEQTVIGWTSKLFWECFTDPVVSADRVTWKYINKSAFLRQRSFFFLSTTCILPFFIRRERVRRASRTRFKVYCPQRNQNLLFYNLIIFRFLCHTTQQLSRSKHQRSMMTTTWFETWTYQKRNKTHKRLNETISAAWWHMPYQW